MAEPTDFLVIGSGVAGMWYALHAAEAGRVTMVTKRQPRESNSAYAQGGIAAVWSDDDHLDNHIRDTLVAGAGLCRRDAVEQTVRTGPQRVKELIAFGAEFTRSHDDPEAYSLHREGGHSHRRILHAADFTGREMVRALHLACVEHPNITILDHHMAVNILTEHWAARRSGGIPPEDDQVFGAYVLDQHTQTVDVFPANITVLAAQARSTPTPPILPSRRATAWRWHGGPGRASRTWSSCSSIPRACTTPRSTASW